MRFVGSDGPPTRYQRNLARLRPFPEDKTLAVYALGRTWKDRALGLALLRLPDHVGMTRRAKAGWARHLLFLRYLRKRGKLSELGPATSFTYETTDGKTITLGLPLIAPEPPTYAGNPDADPGDLSAIFYGE